MDILAGLNPAQKEAVEAISGPVLILAGPGSGKTRVITHRIAYLVRVCGVNPRRIMAVTFTNKAAKQMQERLAKLVSAQQKELTVGTFHAICARILRQDGHFTGIDPNFVIYDDDDQINLIKRSLESAGLDPKQYTPRAIQSAISAAKSAIIPPAQYLSHGSSFFEGVVHRVYERYEQLLKASRALDFDDLLLKTVWLFKENPELLVRYQNRYLHLQVDEFQDTNLVQYELVKQLAGKHRNICAVGDPDQSIYSWRSADVRNILNFEQDYLDAKVVYLEQNYRSTKAILKTASCVISANHQRKLQKLWTENEDGVDPVVVETYTADEEAQYVVNEIDRMVTDGEFRFGDCAITYRTNAQSRSLEEAFIRYGMPYRLVAGTRFYERREVKDMIAYLRLVLNPNDSVSLFRVINVPGRGIGQRTLDDLSDWARSMGLSESEALLHLVEAEAGQAEAAAHPFNARAARALSIFGALLRELLNRAGESKTLDLFDYVLDRTGYRVYLQALPDGEDRFDNVMELRAVASEYHNMPTPEGLAAFLESVALVADVDSLNEGVDAVTLITLHQAKGLEYPVVFIVGMEEGLLPHFRSIDDAGQMEEERRLCYVGITRAQKKLYLVRAFRRMLMGSSTANQPSRFLADIPSNVAPGGKLWSGEATPVAAAMHNWNRGRRPSAEVQADMAFMELKIGDHVQHGQFGSGIVLGARPKGDDMEVTVAFADIGNKKLMLSFARLEKVDEFS
ncbi:ATP-dependent helicase [Chloroflexota bacterium]